MDAKKRLSRIEFDMLSVFMEHHPNPIGFKELAEGLRKKGYVITDEETKEIMENE